MKSSTSRRGNRGGHQGRLRTEPNTFPERPGVIYVEVFVAVLRPFRGGLGDRLLPPRRKRGSSSSAPKTRSRQGSRTSARHARPLFLPPHPTTGLSSSSSSSSSTASSSGTPTSSSRDRGGGKTSWPRRFSFSCSLSRRPEAPLYNPPRPAASLRQPATRLRQSADGPQQAPSRRQQAPRSGQLAPGNLPATTLNFSEFPKR